MDEWQTDTAGYGVAQHIVAATERARKERLEEEMTEALTAIHKRVNNVMFFIRQSYNKIVNLRVTSRQYPTSSHSEKMILRTNL